jgi:hypothetical protein
MGFEDNIEKVKSSGSSKVANKMTLQKAVDLGEYNPDYLSTFAEWHTLSRHIQFQHIRTALENRRKHLIMQWAEINNILDFSKKPDLAKALKNIEDQLHKIEDDRETLFVEYSK